MLENEPRKGNDDDDDDDDVEKQVPQDGQDQGDGVKIEKEGGEQTLRVDDEKFGFVEDCRKYFTKFKGQGKSAPPIPFNDRRRIMIATFGTLVFGGLMAITVHYSPSDIVLIASFGASGVLVFAVPESPLSQPRNMILGQFFAGLIGVIFKLYVVDVMGHPDLAAPFAMAILVLVEIITGTVNPPSGGTVLAAILTPINSIGWEYLGYVMVFSVFSVLVAILVNNLNPKVSYPTYYWG